MSSADKLDEPTFSADYGFDNEARPIRMNSDLRVFGAGKDVGGKIIGKDTQQVMSALP